MIDWIPTLTQNGKPRYLAIAEAIAVDIRTGTLSPGDRLPPQRRLAARLGIDFTTVSRAYSEAQARGLVASHVGRGTFVTSVAPEAFCSDPQRDGEEDLSMNMAPEPTDAALLEKMREGMGYVSANLIALLRYQSAVGSEQDKMAASTWLSMRGMVPLLERIAVTPGAHPTMVAILSILTTPGDVVLCENITYPGIRNIAAQMRVQLKGIAMDAEGDSARCVGGRDQSPCAARALSEPDLAEPDDPDDPDSAAAGDRGGAQSLWFAVDRG